MDSVYYFEVELYTESDVQEHFDEKMKVDFR